MIIVAKKFIIVMIIIITINVTMMMIILIMNRFGKKCNNDEREKDVKIGIVSDYIVLSCR